MIEKLQSIINKPSRLCAGVMSGTSLDGIDIVLCRIHGAGTSTKLEIVYFETLEYTPEERQKLLRACSPDTATVEDICILNKWLGVRIGQGVVQVCQNAGISPAELDFVSSHGQTVYHMPEIGATLQIGELADIAAVTGVITLGDYRPSDTAYGGEGAPLASFFDWLVCRSESKSRVLINTGGIANLTAMPKNPSIDDVVAFDTGPANVLADNLMKLHTQGTLAYDEGGALALSGTVSDALLQSIVAEDPFLPVKPPKTTGRELYTYAYAQKLLERGTAMGLPFADILATIVDFSALCVAENIKQFIPYEVDEYYQSGGGYHNLFFRRRLEERLGKPMRDMKELGVDGDAKEAAFFAIFGNEFLHGNFNNAKKATGADRNVIMGKMALPSCKEG